MIYVVDNGGRYSDHAIYFYSIPNDVPVEDAVWLCEHDPSPDSYGDRRLVIAVAEKFSWRDGKPDDAPWGWTFLRPVADGDVISDETREWLARCPLSLLASIVAAGRRENDRWGNSVAPAWAPRKVRDGAPGWRVNDAQLRALEVWVAIGAPLPPPEVSE